MGSNVVKAPVVSAGSPAAVFFLARCVEGTLERQTMPLFSNSWNSASAMRSFSGSSLRALANKGRPVVSMTCSTPWRGSGGVEEVLRPLGKSDSSWGTHEGLGWTVAATVGESWLVVVV